MHAKRISPDAVKKNKTFPTFIVVYWARQTSPRYLTKDKHFHIIRGKFKLGSTNRAYYIAKNILHPAKIIPQKGAAHKSRT